MLDAHSQVAIALDPLMPLFRSLRNAVVAEQAAGTLSLPFDPKSPFQDYYQHPDGQLLLDLMLDTDLDLKVPGGEIMDLRRVISARAALESKTHAERLQQLVGETYTELFADALNRIAGPIGETLRYVGVKEVWTTEFVRPLMRAFPEARFIVIERDPRDVVLSLQKLASSDESQAAHSVSYMRHWRKNTILARHLMRDDDIASRLRIVRFEDLASAPAEQAQVLCHFLGLDYEPSMIRLEQAVVSGTGQPWQGNSSFETGANITVRPVERWRNQSDAGTCATTEFMCGPEMALAGYTIAPAAPDGLVFDYVLRADRAPGSWRSDSADPIADYGFELFRWQILTAQTVRADDKLIRRCFLFDWVFDALRGASTK